jgi:hypothetical protein
MAWIKASERRPTEDDAFCELLLWRDSASRVFIDRWDVLYATCEWHPIIIPGNNEPAQEPELPQPGQMIWVRACGEEEWRHRPFLRWRKLAVCQSGAGNIDIAWHEWSPTDPNEPPELQYRPFANAEEFWPFRHCWWRNKQSPEHRPPCPFTGDRYGGWSWQACFEKMELLQDVDSKMVARPFGLEVTNET